MKRRNSNQNPQEQSAAAGKQKRKVDKVRRLRVLKFDTPTVFDVGVRKGTPWLYRAFPSAHFVLVDPQRAGLDNVRQLPKSYVYVNKALGGSPGFLEFKEQGAKSTFLDRTELTAAKTVEVHQAEVVTLDDPIDTLDIKGNIGLKIDTEGFELEVLKGLDKHRERVVFILAEVSVRNRFLNSYNASDFINAAQHKGFRFAKVMGRGGTRIPMFIECLFLRHDSQLFD